MSRTILKIAGKLTNTFSENSGKASTAIAGLVVFIIGIGLTLFVIVNPMKVGLFEVVKQAVMPQEEGAAPADGGGKKVLYWYAPMDPTYIMEKPGKSPMGMDLLPKYADEAGDASETGIKIDPVTVQNMGVVTETVERGDLKVDIRTVGNLDYDEGKIFLVNTKYDGWIEKAYINYVGEQVNKGEPLFEIYSPDLVSTQEEYLSALKYRDKMLKSGFAEAEARAEDLLDAARNRLLNWDISEEQIQLLKEKREVKRTLTVVSPASGVVAQKMDQALEGMQAKAGMNLYKIADLSTLWVHIDIYEYQLPWIKVGQEAEIEIGALPGEIIRGKVLFFYPNLDKKTRTIRACVEIPNTDGKLHPDMYATVQFMPVAESNVVLVPETAVLHSGKRDVVVLALGGGRFEPRDVKLGLQGGGLYQVREGLEGGEEIVTSSQFLIDSESNLREAINKMLMAKKGEPPAESMEGSMTKDVEQGSGTKSLETGSGTKGMEHAGHEMMPVVDKPKEIKALQKVINAYLPIWKALANDSTKEIEEHAKDLAHAAKEAADKVEEEMLKTRLEALEKTASELRTDSLENARESMKGLGRAIIAVFESHEVTMPKKYPIIECPMVNERWIQDSEDVQNPFYGSSMLRCGVRVGEIG